jgi:hypothetical protein
MDVIECDGTKSVEELKQLIEAKGRYIQQDCTYIWENYSFLSVSLTKMESSKLSLHDSLAIFQDVVDKVASVQCSVGRKIYNSFKQNIRSNPNLTEMLILDEFLSKKRPSLPENFEIALIDAEFYNLCLLTSVDVERSFSRFKNIYRDNRTFSFENLSKYVFINCNSSS